MYLASIPPVPSATLPIIPSFHRPELIAYFQSNASSAWSSNDFRRQFIFRPMPWDHPRFSGSNPAFNAGTSTIAKSKRDCRLAPGTSTTTATACRTASGSILAGADCPRRQTRQTPGRDSGGRDMDGRINLNAAGSLAQTNATYTSTFSATQIAGSPGAVQLPRGLGVGPADIAAILVGRTSPSCKAF